jgi:fructokinase
LKVASVSLRPDDGDEKVDGSAKLRIGVDLGGTKIEAVMLDADGTVLARKRIATPKEDYPGTVHAVRDIVLTIEKQCDVVERIPVGVAIPGAVSPRTGLIKNANSTWLIGQRFDRDLMDALERPVRLANDANCFALSEAHDGAAAGAGSVFGVIVGTGTGGGLVINGHLHEGPNLIAGEWGHVPMPWLVPGDPPSVPCYCGQNGCIETYLSGPALARIHEWRCGEKISGEKIGHLSQSGHSDAAATLEVYAGLMARALAMVINICDPEVIVLGGGLSNIDSLYDRVPLLWSAYCFSDEITTTLIKARFGDSSGVRGAAWLWPLKQTT